MDEIREIIIEAGKILRDKYFSNFMVHEKEKGHLAADIDMEVELFLKEQLYKIDSSIEFYGEETGVGLTLSVARLCNLEDRDG